MIPEEENFEALRRLLAVKRHEQPPPGYFSSFHCQVIARIEAEEAVRAEGTFAKWLGRYEWVNRVWNMLEGQPAMAGALGLLACGLLAGGVLLSGPGRGSAGISDMRETAVVLSTATAPALARHGLQVQQVHDFSRTNGLRQLHRSLFEAVRNPDAQLVNSFAPAY